MKRLVYPVLLIFILSFLPSVASAAGEICGTAQSYDLDAEFSGVIGSVTVSNDDTTLYVEFSVAGTSWRILQTWVTLGSVTYSDAHGTVTQYEYAIPLTSSPGTVLVIEAIAFVTNIDGIPNVTPDEFAWGDGNTISYTVCGVIDPGPGDPGNPGDPGDPPDDPNDPPDDPGNWPPAHGIYDTQPANPPGQANGLTRPSPSQSPLNPDPPDNPGNSNPDPPAYGIYNPGPAQSSQNPDPPANPDPPNPGPAESPQNPDPPANPGSSDSDRPDVDPPAHGIHDTQPGDPQGPAYGTIKPSPAQSPLNPDPPDNPGNSNANAAGKSQAR